MAWARKRVHVRLYLDREPSTIEGFLIGRANGCYRLAVAEVMESSDRTHELPGEVRVPSDRVTFYQVLPE